MCSSVMPEYSTGMSQPPNSTIRAPSARCLAFRGVFLSWDEGLADKSRTNYYRPPGGSRRARPARGDPGRPWTLLRKPGPVADEQQERQSDESGREAGADEGAFAHA